VMRLFNKEVDIHVGPDEQNSACFLELYFFTVTHLK